MIDISKALKKTNFRHTSNATFKEETLSVNIVKSNTIVLQSIRSKETKDRREEK